MLGYLFSTGIAVTWWHSAQRGTTIEHLHQITNRTFLLQPYNWKWKLFQDSGFSKVFVGACAITLAAFASQPFVQQSTRTKLADITTEGIQKRIDILPQLPDGLTGTSMGESQSETSASFDLSAAAAQWYLNDTIKTRSSPDYTCDGTCHGIVSAPGISVQCSSVEETVFLKDKTIQNQNLFLLNFTLEEDTDSHPFINLTSIYSIAVDSACHATLVTEKCRVYAATTKYPVVIQKDGITLVSRNTSDWNSSELVDSQGDLPSTADGTPAGPLHGLMYLANAYFYSYTTIRRHGSSSDMPTYGLATEVFYIYKNRTENSSPSIGCDYTWRRPTESVLNAMSETLFRLSMNGNSISGARTSGSTNPVTQTFHITHVRTEFVFQSNYAWLAGAVIVELIAFAVALILVWGWWEQVREVSLSPIETMQTMPGLILERDLSADAIVEKFGWLPVRYMPKEGEYL